jgi:hypothetical protein
MYYCKCWNYVCTSWMYILLNKGIKALKVNECPYLTLLMLKTDPLGRFKFVMKAIHTWQGFPLNALFVSYINNDYLVYIVWSPAEGPCFLYLPAIIIKLLLLSSIQSLCLFLVLKCHLSHVIDVHPCMIPMWKRKLSLQS